MLRNTLLIAAFWLTVYGQDPAAPVKESKGLPPRTAPSDYQAQGHAGKVTIAAEFTGHAVPTAQSALSTEDYVVVEVAFFGPPDAHLALSIDDFSLRINGKKSPTPSQPYELVFKTLKDPQWAPPVQAESKSKTSIGGSGGGGKGGAEPGSPPPVVHIPLALMRSMEQDVLKAELPGGDRVLPQAGLIFFSYHGKDQSIHSVELIYNGPAGPATLTLQP